MRLWNSRKSRLRLVHAGDTEPRSVQIAGAEPQMLAEAARANVAMGAQIIDINMGCPAKKVCNKAAGSALMKDEQLVARDPRSRGRRRRCAGHPEDPHRLGPAEQERPDRRAHRRAVRHRRRWPCTAAPAPTCTTAKPSTTPSPRIKQAMQHPGVCQRRHRFAGKGPRGARTHTGADGLLIGRAAQGRPWIFREIDHFLTHGKHLPRRRSLSEVERILLEHLAALHAFYGDVMGVRIARKHVGWYLATLPGAANFAPLQHAGNTRGADTPAIRQFFLDAHDQQATKRWSHDDMTEQFMNKNFLMGQHR